MKPAQMSSLLLGAAMLFVVVAPAMAQSTYTCALQGSSEVPPNASPATGFATVVLNAAQTELSISCQFQNPVGVYTASHIEAARRVVRLR